MSCERSSDSLLDARRQDVRLDPDATTVEAVVPHDATIESLLVQQQIPADMASSVVSAIRGVFNPRELQADRTYWVTRTLDGLFREFRYQIDADNVLRVVFRDGPERQVASFDAEVVTLPRDYELTAVSAEITPDTSSLIGAFDALGENIQLPLQLADIFAGQLDFNSDLKLGDRLDVLFDRVTRNGEFIGYGDVRAAVLQNRKQRLTAVRFIGEDGKPQWYDEQGRSLRRPFLKSPLPFSPRVTSPFSTNRFHPVLGINRPHLGVDFGAPFGTAVNAVADGVVEKADWSGEAGRMVRIRHAGGFETAYLHLSSFGPGIRLGARVEQGQLIGRVGSTGTATGPHLDYRVLKNGNYVNPLTAFSRTAAGPPLSEDELATFNQQRDQALSDLQKRVGTATPAAVTIAARR